MVGDPAAVRRLAAPAASVIHLTPSCCRAMAPPAVGGAVGAAGAAPDGRLAERALLDPASGEATDRKTYGDLGAVRAFDADGTMVAESRLSLRKADSPPLGLTREESEALVI